MGQEVWRPEAGRTTSRHCVAKATRKEAGTGGSSERVTALMVVKLERLTNTFKGKQTLLTVPSVDLFLLFQCYLQTHQHRRVGINGSFYSVCTTET